MNECFRISESRWIGFIQLKLTNFVVLQNADYRIISAIRWRVEPVQRRRSFFRWGMPFHRPLFHPGRTGIPQDLRGLLHQPRRCTELSGKGSTRHQSVSIKAQFNSVGIFSTKVSRKSTKYWRTACWHCAKKSFASTWDRSSSNLCSGFWSILWCSTNSSRCHSMLVNVPIRRSKMTIFCNWSGIPCQQRRKSQWQNSLKHLTWSKLDSKFPFVSLASVFFDIVTVSMWRIGRTLRQF